MAPKRQSAFLKATQEAQSHSETVTPLQSETALQPQRDTVEQSKGVTIPPVERIPVKQAHSDTVKKDKKVTFYLTQEQEDKLHDMEVEIWQRYKKRINRNDIVRYLIDQCSIERLSGLIEE